MTPTSITVSNDQKPNVASACMQQPPVKSNYRLNKSRKSRAVLLTALINSSLFSTEFRVNLRIPTGQPRSQRVLCVRRAVDVKDAVEWRQLDDRIECGANEIGLYWPLWSQHFIPITLAVLIGRSLCVCDNFRTKWLLTLFSMMVVHPDPI